VSKVPTPSRRIIQPILRKSHKNFTSFTTQYGGILDAKAAGGLISKQSTGAFPESLARLCEKAIMRILGHSAALGAEAADGLTSEKK
jgi:hypothetical protein